MFYFILHPLQWTNAADAKVIFNAVRLASNRYIVSWVSGTGLETTTYSTQEVTEALARGMWIMTDEYGNF